MAAKEETALDAARSRFVEGLPKKAAELRAALALLFAAPDDARGRDELRRRLHALHASAQVFRVDELAQVVGGGIGILDQMRRELRAVTDEELDRLLAVSAAVAALGGVDLSTIEAESDDVRRPSVAPAGVARGIEPRVGMQTVVNAQRDLDLVPTRPGNFPSISPSAQSRAGSTAPGPQLGNSPSVPPGPRRPSVTVDTVVSVMLVGPTAMRLAAALPADRFELLPTESRDALFAARVGAPDVIVVGDDIVTSSDSEFVRALRSDPVTDLVPLLLVSARAGGDRTSARAAGCDDVVPVGIEPRALAEKIARLAGLLPSSREAELGTRTLREVADRMADELRLGLVDSAERGADETLSLGDGTELFAAVWSAIARMRTAIVDRSGGKVRFRDTERRGGPAFLSLGETTDAQARTSAADVSLVGRRILVADDDPAVRWFFVGLLQDAGADVLEAPDGRAALELARQHTPDLVITDILMPKLDGLSLSRELHRDPVLSEVPIIFLSWKEDYLQRMRELRAVAAGYLRKEEGAATILDRVRDAFRPRMRFEARLRDGGDVRGRVEGLGVLSLLRSVARIRREARVTVRDVHNVFEIDVRGGQLVELVRTVSDGTFARGGKALASLLGVSAGRFAVLAPTIGQKPGIQPISPEMIEREAQRLGALVDAVSGRGLALADRIDLDPSVVASIMAISPPEIGDVVRKLESNPSPRRWLLSGELAPDVLSGVLVELARRGAVLSVRGEHGEDRVSEALARRRGVDPSALDGGRTRTDTPARTSFDDREIVEDDRLVEVTSDAADEVLDLAQDDVDEITDVVADAEVTELGELPDADDADADADDDQVAHVAPEDVTAADTVIVADDVPAVGSRAAVLEAEAGRTGRAKPSSLRPAGVSPPRRRETHDDTLRIRTEPAGSAESADEAGARRSGLFLAGATLLVLGALTSIGYYASRTPAAGRRGAALAGSTRPGAGAGASPTGRAARETAGRPGVGATAPVRDLEPPSRDPSLYGSPVELGALGVAVPAGEGGLSITGAGSVAVDGVERGAAPVAVSLREGWHTVVLRAGDDEIVRFIPIRAGSARRIAIP